MAYDDYLNKDAFAGGVMDAPDKQTRIAQMKAAAGAFHLLSNKEWDRLSNRMFYEQQSHQTALKQGAKDVSRGFNTPNAQMYQSMQPIPEGRVMPQELAQQAPAQRQPTVIQGRYGGAPMYAAPGGPSDGTGYGSITGTGAQGQDVNIQVGNVPKQAPAPVVSPEAVPQTPVAQAPAANAISAPSTGFNSDVLDSVMKGAYRPQKAGLFDVPLQTKAPSALDEAKAADADFRSKLMGVLGVKPTAPAPKPTAQPGAVANELLSYDAQLASAPAAAPQAQAPVTQQAPVQAAPAQPQIAPQQAITPQAAPAPQQGFAPQQIAPFVPKPYVNTAFQTQSVTETMNQQASMQRYKAENEIARKAYTANVNAQSKAFRDSVYGQLKTLEIGDKQAKAQADKAARQFAESGGQMGQVEIGGKPYVIFQPSYGKFSLRPVKSDTKESTGVARPYVTPEGQVIPGLYFDEGSGKPVPVSPDAAFMQSYMAGGGAPAPAAAAPAKGGQKLSFSTLEEAQAANLKTGTKITVGGRPATVK